MQGPIGSRVRVARGIPIAALLVTTIAPGSSGALAADASPELGGSPAESSPVAEAIHGWPGARAYNNPAGLYAWSMSPGSRDWMHKVPQGWTDAAPNSVEVTFGTLDEYGDVPAAPLAVAGADPSGPYPAVPERVADERLQTWRMDLDDDEVVIIVRSFPDTDPALVAEAEAVVESIRAERTDTGAGYRLVFELPAGWDSG